MPQIVAFTNGSLYECCLPGGDGNQGMKLQDFEVRALQLYPSIAFPPVCTPLPTKNP